MEPIYTCSRCGHARELSEVILDAVEETAFQQAVQAAAQLPPALADVVIRYMRLFGNLRHATYAKVLGDLVTAINTGRFTYKRQEYQAGPALWLAALTDCLASTTIRLPLKAPNGHNFLFAIAADKATRAVAAAERHQALPTNPTPDPRRRELEADIRHWEEQVRIRPNDSSIADILSSARAKLAAEYPD